MNRIISDLPKKKRGKTDCINWDSVANLKVDVEYNNEVYSLFVRGKNNKNKSLIDVSLYHEDGIYKDDDFKPTLTTHFRNGQYGNIIKNRMTHQYNVGDKVKSGNNTEYIILEQTRMKSGLKSYTIQCLKCQSVKQFYGELELGKHDCNECINGFRLNIGDFFKNDKISVIILDRYYKRIKSKLWRFYKYKCNNCGYIGDKEELKLVNHNRGCPCCCPNPQVVEESINSIYAKARWMCDLGMSEEDAKIYTPLSNKFIDVICPTCGNKSNKNICNIYTNKSIGCTCGDGFSYPEKFMYNILKQLNVEFETQYSPTWIKPKRYDFYIPSLNMIIETHGLQHYEDCRRGRTLKEEQENDIFKRCLAKINNVSNYIELDCRNSDIEYIKNSILNSDLVNHFNMSYINFLYADEFAIKSNLVKEVCDYWNNKEEWETTGTMSSNNVWGIKSNGTIREYLKKGTIQGWCNYNPELESYKTRFK